MALPPNSGIPIVPLFSSVPTSRSSWNSSPLWATRQLDLQVGPTHVHEDRVWTSDGSTLNQLPAKRPKMDSPLSQGSSFNTSSDTSADQTVPLDLTKKKCDDGLRMTEKRDIENVPSAPSSARDGTPVPTNRTLPNSWHTPVPTSRTLPRSWHTPVTISRTFPRSWHTPCECPATSSAGWEDPTHVHEASDRSTLNQSPTKRPKMDSLSSQGSSFNTSSDTSYDGRKMTIQGKPNPSSHKKTTKRDIGIDFPLNIHRTEERTFKCTSVKTCDKQKDSKKLIDSLDLDRIKNFNETKFIYKDGVITAKSLGTWIRNQKYLKQGDKQKAIIVLPKGERFPEDFNQLMRLVGREPDFSVALLYPKRATDGTFSSRHYKFIFEGGFELHVAKNSKSEEFHYFGRFPSDPTVFYGMNEPAQWSDGIQKILNEERMWKFTQREVFGKTILVTESDPKLSQDNSAITQYPRLWYDKGHVILYSRNSSLEMDEKETFAELVTNRNNLKITWNIATAEANDKLKKLGVKECTQCVEFTLSGSSKLFEFFCVEYGRSARHYYFRNMDRPHVFLLLNSRVGRPAEEVFMQAANFQLADGPAALVSRARSQLGKTTEKKTRESNYQGLVLVSMVSCLVFVSTYWALGKKE